MGANNKGMYALVLQCNDLRQAEKALVSRGMGVTRVMGLNNVLELDRAAIFNTRFWVESENHHV
ncbi:MAG: hypothetical protein DRQ98_02220 [Gammaproteobacteria bacterium]|nr:MAG: hypothetical protein DRQ98_02220 [Gammaproteobacteria bacterium]